jgi:hypothetical protein
MVRLQVTAATGHLIVEPAEDANMLDLCKKSLVLLTCLLPLAAQATSSYPSGQEKFSQRDWQAEDARFDSHVITGRAGAEGHKRAPIQLGPRPYYLVDDMDPSPLKNRLKACAAQKHNFTATQFSIGHRGAALQFPEHTKQSYEAAARTGAGVIECDVTFTADKQLVCRHSQCDLHTTTNILAVPELAAKCRQPFSPADELAGKAASAECCTSDITLAEFKTLNGKMDGGGFNSEVHHSPRLEKEASCS